MKLRPLGARSWEFSGAVTVPPPAADGEMRVLGHHLSPTASQLYSDAQARATWAVRVLPGLEDDKYIQACTTAIEHNIEQYLLRHMHDRAATIANLPEDVPPSDGLRVVPVQEGDYRTGLKPLQDLAVHASRPYTVNSVLGVYRSLTMLPAEELALRHNPPPDYPLSTVNWRQAIDAYAAELAPSSKRTWGKLLLRDVYDKALQGQQLVCSGFGYGNILANVNDGCADPMSFQPSLLDRPANVQLLPVAVGRWPFLFMVACQDIEPGELYLDYGRNFWEIQRDREMEIKAWQRELDQALQRERMLQKKKSFHCESVSEAHVLKVQAGKKKAAPKQAMQSAGASAVSPGLFRKRKVGPAPADEPDKQAKKAKQAQQAASQQVSDSQGLRTQAWHAPRSQQAKDPNEIMPSKKVQHAQQAQQHPAWVDSTARDLWAPIDGRYWCPDPNCAKASPQQLFKGYKTFRSVRRHVLNMVKGGLGHWGLELDLPCKRKSLKSNFKCTPTQSLAAVATALDVEPKACTAWIDSSLVPVLEAASAAAKAGTTGKAGIAASTAKASTSASAAKAGTAAEAVKAGKTGTAGEAAKAGETGTAGKAGAASQAGSRRQRGPTGHFLRESTKPDSQSMSQAVNFGSKAPLLPELGKAPSKQKTSGRRVSKPLFTFQQELLGVESTAGSSQSTTPLTGTAGIAATAGTVGMLQSSNQHMPAVSQLRTDTSMFAQQRSLGSKVPQSYGSAPVSSPMTASITSPCTLLISPSVNPPVRPLGKPPIGPPPRPLVEPLARFPVNTPASPPVSPSSKTPIGPPPRPLVEPLATPPLSPLVSPPVSPNTATLFNLDNPSTCHPKDSTASVFFTAVASGSNVGPVALTTPNADTSALPPTAPSPTLAPGTTPSLAPDSVPLPSTIPQHNAVPSTIPQLNSETQSLEPQTRLSTSCNLGPSSAPDCTPAADPTPPSAPNPGNWVPSLSAPNYACADSTPPAAPDPSGDHSGDLSVSNPTCTPAAELSPFATPNPSGDPSFPFPGCTSAADPTPPAAPNPSADPSVSTPRCTPAADPTPPAAPNPSGDPSMSTPNCTPAADPTPPAASNPSDNPSVSTPNCSPAADTTPPVDPSPSGDPSLSHPICTPAIEPTPPPAPRPAGDPSLTLRAPPLDGPAVPEPPCTPSQVVKGHDRVVNPMLDPSMGSGVTPRGSLSFEYSLESSMVQDEHSTNGLCGPLGNPPTSSIQVGIGPQDGRGDATGTPKTPPAWVGVGCQTGRDSPTGTPTPPSTQAAVTFKHGRGVSLDPKLGMATPQPEHRASDTAGVAVQDVPTHMHGPHAHAEQLGSYMLRDCSEEEEEGDSISSLGLSSLEHVMESAEAFPPLEELCHLCCSLQHPAGFGLAPAAELSAVSAAESTAVPAAEESWAAAAGSTAATAVEKREAARASSDAAVTAVEEAEAVTASNTVAATAVEEPTTPEGCSSLTLLTTHTSPAADSLPDSHPLSSFTTPLASLSSAAGGMPPGLALSSSLASSAAPADGLSQSSPSVISSKAPLDPFCLQLNSDTVQEDSRKIPDEGQEDSRSQQQPRSCQGHPSKVQTVRLCEEDKCALLEELAQIQVDKQRLCPQKHLLASMFERVKQAHVKGSLRRKRIVHLLATGTKSKMHIVDQPAWTHLVAKAPQVDLGPMAITHSLGPNRSMLAPSVRLSGGEYKRRRVCEVARRTMQHQQAGTAKGGNQLAPSANSPFNHTD